MLGESNKDLEIKKDQFNECQSWIDYLVLGLYISGILGYFLPFLYAPELISDVGKVYSSFELLFRIRGGKSEGLIFWSAIFLPAFFMSLGLLYSTKYFAEYKNKIISTVFEGLSLFIGFYLVIYCGIFGFEVLNFIYNNNVPIHDFKIGFYLYVLPFSILPIILVAAYYTMAAAFVYKFMYHGFFFIRDLFWSKSIETQYPNFYKFSNRNNIRGVFYPNLEIDSKKDKINNVIFIIILIGLTIGYFLPLFEITLVEYDFSSYFFYKNENLLQSIPYVKDFYKYFLFPGLHREVLFLGIFSLAIIVVTNFIPKTTILNLIKLILILLFKFSLFFFSIYTLILPKDINAIKPPEIGLNQIDQITASMPLVELSIGYYILLILSLYYLVVTGINIIIWVKRKIHIE